MTIPPRLLSPCSATRTGFTVSARRLRQDRGAERRAHRSRSWPVTRSLIEHVTAENTSSALAFFVRLRVTNGKENREIAPIIWDDNYFELFPGEKRELTATFARKYLGGGKASIQVEGWNVGSK